MPANLGPTRRPGRPPILILCNACLGHFPSRYFDRYHAKHCWIKPIMEMIAEQIAVEEAAAERAKSEAA